MSDLVGMVNGAAVARGETPLEPTLITEAYERVQAGKIGCARYPTGHPTLRGLYDIAVKLSIEKREHPRIPEDGLRGDAHP